MKPRALFLTFMLTCFICCTSVCQDWIGTRFLLDTALTLTHSGLPQDLSQLRCVTSGDVLYFTDMKSYQRKSTDHAATIYAVNLKTLEQNALNLPFPGHTKMKEQTASTYWINDFSIDQNHAIVTVQDNILIYRRAEDGSCIFDTLFYHPRVKALYVFNRDLYYLEEDHENGYAWFRRKNLYGDETEIGRLKYDAPHVVQANPNRYLFHTDSALYFLSTRHPQFEQYTLDGKLVRTITMDLPQWHPFEDEYIRKSLDVPYGVERIRATMGDIFSYSYPKMLFPIGDEYLLYFAQYDTMTHKSHLQYAIVGPAGKSHLYSRHDTSSAPYVGDRFPFNFLDRYADKARTSWHDKLIEICLDSDVDWTGLVPEAFKQAEEKFYKKSEPILKIRIHTYNNNWVTEKFFCDSERQPLSLADLSGHKQVVLVNQALECSACRNELLRFLNTVDTSSVKIGILYPSLQGVLQTYELRRSIRANLTLPYRLLFLLSDRNGEYPRYAFPPDLSYPALLFYDSSRAPILFSTDQIFVDDPGRFEFRDEFLKYTQQFFDINGQKR